MTSLTSLPADGVWGILVLDSDGFSANLINANIAGASSDTTSSLSLHKLSDNGTAYIEAKRANGPPQDEVAGLDAIAVRPLANGDAEASQVYGISTAGNSLVVINADGTQRQLFKDGQIDAATGLTIDGLKGATSIAVTANGYVLVSGTAEGKIAIFQSVGDNLKFVGTTGAEGGHFYDSLTIAGSHVIASGADGVRVYSLQADGHFTNPQTVSTSAAAEVAIDGSQHAFVVDAVSDELRVVDLARGTTLQTLSGVALGLDGASDVATYGAPGSAFVYVTARDGNTIAVFSNSNGLLTHVQTLRNGQDGVKGLAGPADVQVTPDGRYVIVLGSAGDTLAVFQRQAGDGTLVFAQVVRDNVGGISGLGGPASLAFGGLSGNSLQMLVGSLGSALGVGGLSQYTLDLSPVAPPAHFITEHAFIEAISLTTMGGNDTIRMTQAPSNIVASTSIFTGDGEDAVVVVDYGHNTTIHLEAGNDTADLRSQTADRSLAVYGDGGNDSITMSLGGLRANTGIFGGAGHDTIVVERVSQNSTTFVSGGSDPDIVRVTLNGLPLSARFTADGELPNPNPIPLPYDPATGDILQLVTGSLTVDAVMSSPFDPRNGSAHGRDRVSNAIYGTLDYSNFEGVVVVKPPVVNFTSANYSFIEGDRSPTQSLTGRRAPSPQFIAISMTIHRALRPISIRSVSPLPTTTPKPGPPVSMSGSSTCRPKWSASRSTKR
ncbi:lactonase family protein [Devosia psychrophila]|nr:beta-propeller fold lactonase family protein [Devosia psychrophila]